MSKQKNIDGWNNVATLLGTSRDKKTHLNYSFSGVIPEGILNDLYRGEGVSTRIIDLPVIDMTREWFEVENQDDEYQEIYKKFEFKKNVIKHLKWDKLHGGSVMLAVVEDGGELFEPVFENSLKSIKSLHVFDRWQVSVRQEYYNTFNSENFGKPEFYDINPIYGSSFPVHYTRVQVLDGKDITDRDRHNNNTWGDSALQAPYNYIKSLANTYSNVESIVEDFIQAVLSMDNLSGLVSSGQEDIIKKRIEILDMTRSIINTLLIDSKEKYEKKASSVTGLDKIIQEFCISICAVTGIPMTVLFGRSPAGENATGESDIRLWYDKVAFDQELKMLPVVNWVNNLISKCKDYKVSNEVPVVNFTPLWQPTEKETVDNRHTQAKTDEIYWKMNSLTDSEIRENRFSGDVYSYETHVIGEAPEEDNEMADDNINSNGDNGEVK